MSEVGTSGDESDVEYSDEVWEYPCLLCKHVSTDGPSFFKHLEEVHGLSPKLLSKHVSDQYQWIRFVNACRELKPVTIENVVLDDAWRVMDSFLKPVKPDDLVLTLDYEALLKEYNIPIVESLESPEPSNGDLLDKLENENKLLKEKLRRCTRLLSEALESKDKTDNSRPFTPDEIVESESSADASYFATYSHHSIHRDMINDDIRTDAYRNFIMKNADKIFRDKIVLDVGAGSGILSLFMAEAGAKHVYAVEGSAEMFAIATETIISNGLEKRITLIKGRMENVELPVDQVDVIVSEWMGYMLLYECMLDSVLDAARRYLSPNGAIYPRCYQLRFFPAECSRKLLQDELNMWNNVYGYKMPAMRRSALREVNVIDLTAKAWSKYSVVPLADLQNMHEIDLAKREWLHYRRHEMKPYNFEFHVTKTGTLHAFCCYFDCQFDDEAQYSVSFSTGPFTEGTHWKQSLLFLETSLQVKAGQTIRGSIVADYSTAIGSRDLVVKLKLRPLDATQPMLKQVFTLQ